MAYNKKIVFIIDERQKLVEVPITFQSTKDFAKDSQLLYQQFKLYDLNKNILEVSTKSTEALGRKLCAFNLMFTEPNGKSYSVESAYQASKVFEKGGPYSDLLNASSYEAKKDSRLRTSGDIIKFQFKNQIFNTEPKTFFYNWLYLSALNQHPELKKELIDRQFTAFSDIAYDPSRMVNCQARALSIYVFLERKGLFEKALSNPEEFLQVLKTYDLDSKDIVLDKKVGAYLAFALGDILSLPQLKDNENSIFNFLNSINQEELNEDNILENIEKIEIEKFNPNSQMLLSSSRAIISNDWKKNLLNKEFPLWLKQEGEDYKSIKEAVQLWSNNQAPWENDNARERYFGFKDNDSLFRVLPHVIVNKQSRKDLLNDIFNDCIFTHGNPDAILNATCYGYVLNYILTKKEGLELGEFIDSALKGFNEWASFDNFTPPESWLNKTKELSFDYLKAWENSAIRIQKKLEYIKKAVLKGSFYYPEYKVFNIIGCYTNEEIGDNHENNNLIGALYLSALYVSNPELGFKMTDKFASLKKNKISSLSGSLLGIANGPDCLSLDSILKISKRQNFINMAIALNSKNSRDAKKQELPNIKNIVLEPINSEIKELSEDTGIKNKQKKEQSYMEKERVVIDISDEIETKKAEIAQLRPVAEKLAIEGYSVVTTNYELFSPWNANEKKGKAFIMETVGKGKGKTIKVDTVEIQDNVEKILLAGESNNKYFKNHATMFIRSTPYGIMNNRLTTNYDTVIEEMTSKEMEGTENEYKTVSFNLGSKHGYEDFTDYFKSVKNKEFVVSRNITPIKTLVIMGNNIKQEDIPYFRDIVLATKALGISIKVPDNNIYRTLEGMGAKNLIKSKVIGSYQPNDERKDAMEQMLNGFVSVIDLYSSKEKADFYDKKRFDDILKKNNYIDALYQLNKNEEKENLLFTITKQINMENEIDFTIYSKLPKTFELTVGKNVKSFDSISKGYEVLLSRMKNEALTRSLGRKVSRDDELNLLDTVFKTAWEAQDVEIQEKMTKELAQLSPRILINDKNFLVMPYKEDGTRFEIKETPLLAKEKGKEFNNLEEALDMLKAHRETGGEPLFKAIANSIFVIEKNVDNLKTKLATRKNFKWYTMNMIDKSLNDYFHSLEIVNLFLTSSKETLINAIEKNKIKLENLNVSQADNIAKEITLSCYDVLKEYIINFRALTINPKFRIDAKLPNAIKINGDDRSYPTIKSAILSTLLPPDKEILKNKLVEGGVIYSSDFEIDKQAKELGLNKDSDEFLINFVRPRLQNVFINAYKCNGNVAKDIIALSAEDIKDIKCYSVPYVNEYIEFFERNTGRDLAFGDMIKSYAKKAGIEIDKSLSELEGKISTFLTDEQKAVIADDKSKKILIIATAGAGKTTTLVERLIKDIEVNSKADNTFINKIAVFSFTNNAADEFSERISKHPAMANKKLPPQISTAHKFALNILRKYPKEAGLDPSFSIFDGIAKDEKLITALGGTTSKVDGNNGSNDVNFKISFFNSLCSKGYNLKGGQEALSKNISFANAVRKNNEYSAIGGIDAFWYDYKAYQKYLKDSNKIDFSDILTTTIALLETNPQIQKEVQDNLKLLLIDEYQDTNRLQKKLEMLICSPDCIKIMVGDFDQSIYGFNGSEPRIIEETIKEEQPTIHKIDINQRCKNTAIVDFFKDYVEQNETDRAVSMDIKPSKDAIKGEKPSLCVRDDTYELYNEIEKEIIRIAEKNRKAGVPEDKIYEGIAVLVRGNKDKNELKKYLTAHGHIPVFKPKANPYSEPTVKVAETVIRAIENPKSVNNIVDAYQSIYKETDDTWKDVATIEDLLTKVQSEKYETAYPKLNNLIDVFNIVNEQKNNYKNLYDMTLAFMDTITPLLDNGDVLFTPDALANLSTVLGKYPPNLAKEFSDDLVLRKASAKVDTDIGEDDVNGHVYVGTIHSAKGSQFKNAIIVGAPFMSNTVDVNDEVRTYYVGFTRAIETLSIFCKTNEKLDAFSNFNKSLLKEMDSKSEENYKKMAVSGFVTASKEQDSNKQNSGISEIKNEINKFKAFRARKKTEGKGGKNDDDGGMGGKG